MLCHFSKFSVGFGVLEFGVYRFSLIFLPIFCFFAAGTAKYTHMLLPHFDSLVLFFLLRLSLFSLSVEKTMRRLTHWSFSLEFCDKSLRDVPSGGGCGLRKMSQIIYSHFWMLDLFLSSLLLVVTLWKWSMTSIYPILRNQINGSWTTTRWRKQNYLY